MKTSSAQQIPLFGERPKPAPVAAAPEPPCLADRIMEHMSAMAKRADRELQELKELHAEIEGVPVDQIDAYLAAEEAKQREQMEAIRRDRPAPAPTGKRGKKAAASAPVSPPMARLTDRQRELLHGFEVRGNVARFTSEERISDWAAVKAVFISLGAKWRSGKPGGFHFPETDDGAEKVRLAIETGEILDPKAAGFFPTPAALADRLVAMAELRPGELVLEPSAGKGAIALAVRRVHPDAKIECVELLPDNQAELRLQGLTVAAADFMSWPVAPRFAAVVMNPPFGERQDIHHIRRAFEFLSPGGRLVSVASAGLLYRDDKLATDVRAWVAKRGGEISLLPEGSFLESGTGVRTCVVKMRRSP